MNDDSPTLVPPTPKSGTRSLLRDALISGYAELKKRLTRRLGSADRAEDALQETYLRIENTAESAEIQSPQAYLMRVATNLAADRGRSERRLLSAGEVQDFFDQAEDKLPGPESSAMAQSEIGLLEKALLDLPTRRREMLLASRLAETPHLAIAARFGVSTRTVEIEIKRALEHCSQRVGRRAIQRFGPRQAQTSNDQGDDAE